MAVAISGDTLVAGAPYETDRGLNAGAVYLFERSGGVWSEKAKLFGSDTAGNHYYGLSLTIDETTFAAGTQNAQAVYVFKKALSIWSAAGAAHRELGRRRLLWVRARPRGRSPSPSAPTSPATAARQTQGRATSSSAAGPSGRRSAHLVAGDTACPTGHLGFDVALEGDTIALGAKNPPSGSAYVFQESGGSLDRVARTIVDCSGEVGEQFATALDLHGGSLLIGAYEDDHVAPEGRSRPPPRVGRLLLHCRPTDSSVGLQSRRPTAATWTSCWTRALRWRDRSTSSSDPSAERRPAFPMFGVLLPLNYDAFLAFTASHPNTPPYANSFGFLDGEGKSTGSFSLPGAAAAGIAGLRLDHAYLVIDPGVGASHRREQPGGLQHPALSETSNGLTGACAERCGPLRVAARRRAAVEAFSGRWTRGGGGGWRGPRAPRRPAGAQGAARPPGPRVQGRSALRPPRAARGATAPRRAPSARAAS